MTTHKGQKGGKSLNSRNSRQKGGKSPVIAIKRQIYAFLSPLDELKKAEIRQKAEDCHA